MNICFLCIWNFSNILEVKWSNLLMLYDKVFFVLASWILDEKLFTTVWQFLMFTVPFLYVLQFQPPDIQPMYENMPMPPTHRDVVINAFVFVHQSLHQANTRVSKRGGRTMAITPRHYLDFIHHFVSNALISEIETAVVLENIYFLFLILELNKMLYPVYQ